MTCESLGHVGDRRENQMDEIKDTQKTDSISQFVDGQNVRTNPFGDNRAGDRAYRRAERISAALYLLTNHVANTEPVRSSVRSLSLLLLNEILLMRDEMRSPQSSGVRALQGHIRQLISYVRVLSVSGFISVPNASTMIEALDELGNFLTVSQKSSLAESFSVSREGLLDVHGGYTPKAQKSTKDIRDTQGIKDKTLVSDTTLSVTASVDNGPIKVRALSIIEILKVSGTLGIRDISSNLPEYSEKMIQRELLDLVSQGKVRKTGLKRWSRYGLAT